MKGRRSKLALTLVLASAALAAVGAALVTAIPRIRRQRALERVIEATRRYGGEESQVLFQEHELTLWRLTYFDEVEALLALVDVYRRLGDAPSSFPLRKSVELFAMSRSQDSRPREALEALAANASATPGQRFVALCLLRELQAPTFPPEPIGFTFQPEELSGRNIVIWPLGAESETLDRLDRPYRRFVRLAQQKRAKLVPVDGGFRFVAAPEEYFSPYPPSPEELVASLGAFAGCKASVDPRAKLPNWAFFEIPYMRAEHALHGLAVVNGCVVRVSADGSWVIEPKSERAP